MSGTVLKIVEFPEHIFLWRKFTLTLFSARQKESELIIFIQPKNNLLWAWAVVLLRLSRPLEVCSPMGGVLCTSNWTVSMITRIVIPTVLEHWSLMFQWYLPEVLDFVFCFVSCPLLHSFSEFSKGNEERLCFESPFFSFFYSTP